MLSIAAGLTAPVAFWLAYLYVRDRVRPEPLVVVLVTVGLGALAALATPHAYAYFAPLGTPEDVAVWSESDPLRLVAYCLGVIGPLEELAKLLPFLLVCVHFRAFDEEIDGMVYASAIGLGFATVENVHLLDQLDGLQFHARALASPLVHTLFASIWGWAYAHARVHRRSIPIATAIAWIAAAALHGVYDVLALSPMLAPASALLILAIWLWRIRLMRRLHIRAERSERRARLRRQGQGTGIGQRIAVTPG